MIDNKSKDTIISNTQAIETLKGLVADETTRYQIITLDTIIGSYKARKNYALETQRTLEDFEIGRITAQRYESRYIAQQRTETLNLLIAYKPQEVLERLQQETKNFELDNLPTYGLYEKLVLFDSDELKSRIGKRLETKLTKNPQKRDKRRISNNTDSYRIENIFNEEAEEISTTLFYEIEGLPL